MKHLRAALKLTAILMLTVAAYLFLEVTSAGLRVFRSARGAPASVARWRTRVFRRWARWIRRLIGMKIELRGRPPEPPFILVANHLGYVDVVLLATQLRCVFVAKAELSRWPMVGRICGSVDTLFIDRESKRDIPRVMRRIEEILRGGRGVVIFPEGTSTDGTGVQRFKPSLLEAAARAGLPVSYASLSYRTPPANLPANLAICWWGEMPLGPHLLQMLGLREFSASLTFGEEPIRETDRKVLAARLQHAVERQFRPVA